MSAKFSTSQYCNNIGYSFCNRYWFHHTWWKCVLVNPDNKSYSLCGFWLLPTHFKYFHLWIYGDYKKTNKPKMLHKKLQFFWYKTWSVGKNRFWSVRCISHSLTKKTCNRSEERITSFSKHQVGKGWPIAFFFQAKLLELDPPKDIVKLLVSFFLIKSYGKTRYLLNCKNIDIPLNE